MGKTTTFLREGQDFDFSRGTAAAITPRNHPTSPASNEFGDSAILAREAAEPTYAKGGKVAAKAPAKAEAGGPALPGGKKMPKAGKAIMGALALGKAIGQATASKGAPPAGPGPALGGPPPGAMPGPAGLPMGGMPMKKGGKACMADGGKVDDMGLYDKSGKALETLEPGNFSRISKSQAAGRQAGSEDYPRIKRVQDAAVQPVRAMRKAADYVGEKYGDIRDSASSAMSGNPDNAEFRAGQRDVRKDVLGYSKGGKRKR